MTDTGYSRKIDSSGRLVIPAHLREQLNINVGEEYHFFTAKSKDGKTYLCIECYNIENDIEKAKRLLSEAGYTVKDKK